MDAFAPFKSAAARERYLARHAERSRDWPEPWTERMVTTEWGDTYVRESGREGAPPLVMLPGVGSASYTLGHLARHLAGHFRLYAVDNIYDTGRSIAARPLANADDFASWLNGLFDALKLTKPDVLGLSYGGWVFAQYALRHPERVRRAVLLAPAGTVAPINFAFVWRAVATLIGGTRFMDRFADWAAPYMARNPQWAAERQAMIEDSILGQKSFARRRLIPPIPPSDDDWGKLRVPTLLMFGDHEVIFDPAAAATKMARVAPRMKIEILPDASHDLFIVRAEEVAMKVRAFLAGE